MVMTRITLVCLTKFLYKDVHNAVEWLPFNGKCFQNLKVAQSSYEANLILFNCCLAAKMRLKSGLKAAKKLA